MTARIANLDAAGSILRQINEQGGTYHRLDLVICGSLLLHLPDPVGAVRALRSVTGRRPVVSTAAVSGSANATEPVCHFLGQRAGDGDYWAYWALSAPALERMVIAAGFCRVDHVEHFELRSQPTRTPFSTAHVALSAYV